MGRRRRRQLTERKLRLFKQRPIVVRLDIGPEQFDVESAVVSGLLQRGDRLAQRQLAAAEPATLLVDRRRRGAITQVYDADVRREFRQVVALPRFERKVKHVVRQLQARAFVFVDQLDDRSDVGEKRPIGGACRVPHTSGPG